MPFNTYCLKNIRPTAPVSQVRLKLTGTQPDLERVLGEQARKAAQAEEQA